MLRVPSNFRLTLASGITLTCAEAASQLLAGTRRWEVRSAGKGSKGDRWYGVGVAGHRLRRGTTC